MKFGKLPARPGAVRLKFSEVFRADRLSAPPALFGHEALMPGGDWFILGNSDYGDCVFAGAAHEHMLWTMEGGLPRARFTARDVLGDYAAVTGFDASDPATDQGTDMQAAAAYRQKTGVIDADGHRHRIDAYAALKPGDVNELSLAAWLFGAVGVGVRCPASMQSQFDAGEPWSVVPGDAIEGGHYAPCVGRNSKGHFVFITWGRLQAATPEWVESYMDEGIAWLDLEMINASTKLSPESFDLSALSQYLKGLR